MTLEQYLPGHREQRPAQDLLDLLGAAGRAGAQVVVKTHLYDLHRVRALEPEQKRLLEQIEASQRSVFVFRDPRDVLMSLERYFRSFMEEPPTLKQLASDAHLLAPDGSTVRFFDQYRDYCAVAFEGQDAVRVRFEDWSKDFRNTLQHVVHRLALTAVPAPKPVSPGSPVSSAVQPGRGVVGGWRRGMPPDIAREVENALHDEMAALGYC